MRRGREWFFLTFVVTLFGVQQFHFVVGQFVIRVDESHLQGGRLHSSVRDSDRCLLTCVSDSSCLGLDFNANDRTCWLHTSANICNAPIAKHGCTHYRFTACPLQPSPVGISQFKGVHFGGGVLHERARSLTACLDDCHVLPGCAGFDFVTTDRSCWLHTVETSCSVPRPKPDTTHYRFMSCRTSSAALPAPPETASSVPPLTAFENYINTHVRGGTLVTNTVLALDSCLHQCWKTPSCQGFDWNAPFQECYLHTETTVCHRLIDKPGCIHYRVRANCIRDLFSGCSTITYSHSDRARRQNGHVVGTALTMEACQNVCTADHSCLAFDHVTVTQQCVIYNTTGLPTLDNCCGHRIKQCATKSSSSTTTRYPVTQASTPPRLGGQINTDDGVCPSKYVRLADTRQDGGRPVSSANDVQSCKNACDAAASCSAVDFSLAAPPGERCFLHTIVDSLISDTCCILLQKTKCATKKCYIHKELDFTQDLDAISPIGLLQLAYLGVREEPCGGFCTSTMRLNASDSFVTYKLQRGCTRQLQQPATYCDDLINTSGQPVTCACYGDKCNGVTPSVLAYLAAYYPLDNTALDYGSGRRHGRAVHVSYDSADKQKNWTAVFNGSAYIQIDSFAHYALGNMENQIPRLRFTILFWFKRTSVRGVSSMLSNGVLTRGASLSIFSRPSSFDVDYQDVVASVKVRDNAYTVTTTASINEWHYFGLRMIGQPGGNYSVQLFLDDMQHPANEVDTGLPESTRLLVDPSIYPMYIGAQPASVTSATGDFFIGRIDEVYIITNALSGFEMNAMKALSSTPDVFNP